MKITVAQTNTTPRDLKGNLDQIFTGIDDAAMQGATCVVFPELSIPGYGVKDCIYDREFIDANLRAVEEVKSMSHHYPDLYIVVGYIDHNRTGMPGKPYFNCAAVINNGLVVGVYRKHLLPFYDVFDEGRYYEPGRELLVWTMGGRKWGLIICEDGWNDKDQDDYLYENNPLEQYRRMGVKNIVSVNSSPFTTGKPARRVRMFSENSKGGMTIVYCNQIGGQDELGFDGHSFVSVNGETIWLCEDNAEPSYNTINLAGEDSYATADPEEEPGVEEHVRANTRAMEHVGYGSYWRDLHDMVLMVTRDYAKKCGFKRGVFGSSGGIDSAVVAYFCSKVFGPENTYGVRMPSIYSSEGSKADAHQLHENLGCRDVIISVDHMELLKHVRSEAEQGLGFNHVKSLGYSEVADENIQARLRGMYIMHLSNAYGMLPLTTGNKSELALGYCTLGGDMMGTFNPVGDCYKMEVYGLADYVNWKEGREVIPKPIILKKPSAELKPGQVDTDSLLPYPLLDPIIMAYVENYVTTWRDYVRWAERMTCANAIPFLSRDDQNGLLRWLPTPNAEAEYLRMVGKIDFNEFKRRLAAMCPKLHKVAFGTGRRLPVVKGKV